MHEGIKITGILVILNANCLIEIYTLLFPSSTYTHYPSYSALRFGGWYYFLLIFNPQSFTLNIQTTRIYITVHINNTHFFIFLFLFRPVKMSELFSILSHWEGNQWCHVLVRVAFILARFIIRLLLNINIWWNKK